MQEGYSLTLTVNPELYSDLQQAATVAECGIERFASECVESVLAERRLAKLPPSEDSDRPHHYGEKFFFAHRA